MTTVNIGNTVTIDYLDLMRKYNHPKFKLDLGALDIHSVLAKTKDDYKKYIEYCSSGIAIENKMKELTCNG